MSILRSFTSLSVIALLAALLYSSAALAIYPPEQEMLERMEREGTLEAAKARAKELGNHLMKSPKRGALPIDTMNSRDIASLISQNLGRSLDGERTVSEIGRSTSQELDWVELDLNHDRVVDERDLLALGQPRPKVSAGLPSLGTQQMPVLVIDFPDYPHYFSAEHFHQVLFTTEGDGVSWYKGLRAFYEDSSDGQLILDGDILGWYTAKHPRTYYHPNDSNGYPWDGARQSELLNEAVTAADQSGTDFSKYDNDGDGYVDQLTVIWSGPNGDWATFWWGYQTWWGDSPLIDGVRFGSYSWQWERGYYFNSAPPEPEYWDTGVVVHETGHALGIPDWYDYDDSVGPRGGVGGMDIMGGWSGEHCSYNKYFLGWLNPKVAYSNLPDEELTHTINLHDSVIFMPGFDPVSPWTEFFMAESRKQEGLDVTLPGSGMVFWHIDASVGEGGWTRYNNSYSDHKLLRLMEADGLEEIENGGGANAGDLYQPGQSLGPETIPSSDGYNGPTGMVVDDLQALDGAMSADFTLYNSNPPSVSITGVTAGSTVSGSLPVAVLATDDTLLEKIQLLSDGLLVAEWTASPGNFQWNTLLEFNKELALEARAWDEHGQMASEIITLSVDNAGLNSYGDGFEGDLSGWRMTNPPQLPGGHYTRWGQRVLPEDPVPNGSGMEAFVEPLGNPDEWHAAQERMRSQRINTSGFERAIHLRFKYRCRDGFAIFSTEDNGQSWQLVEKLTPSWEWREFNRGIEHSGGHIYFELRYSGSLHVNDGNSWGAHIDDFSAEQAASAPPTVAITSHSDGDTVTGLTVFGVEATDDVAVSAVDFYFNNGHVHRDEEAPFEYERFTPDDDDHPGILVKVIAEDSDGILSAPDQITVAWANERAFPVFDDLESGDQDGWGPQNDDKRPNWEFTDTNGTLGEHSWLWFGAGVYDQHNSDGMWYSGPPVLEGRRAIDLSHPECVSPHLSFKYKGDSAAGISGAIYLYTTWEGWRHVGDWLGTQNRFTDNEWVDVEMSLERFIGYSGNLVWWTWTGEDTDGREMWIDEIAVGNKHIRGPQVLGAENGRQAGETVTVNGRFFLDSGGTVYLGPNTLDVSSWDVGSIDVMIEGEPGDYALSVETRMGDISEPITYTVIEPLAVSFSGLDPATLYLSEDTPALSVATAVDAERVELLIDGDVIASSETAPFEDLSVAAGLLRNGSHSVVLRAYRRSIMAESEPVSMSVFTLRGDVNGDGFVDFNDAAALGLYVGLAEGDPDFRPWYDCDEDGRVTEADLSYIGYFGTFS